MDKAEIVEVIEALISGGWMADFADDPVTIAEDVLDIIEKSKRPVKGCGYEMDD